jgi:hypothetical protein
LIKPDLKFIRKDLRREFCECLAPGGDEGTAGLVDVRVFAASSGYRLPTVTDSLDNYPSPGFSALGADEDEIVGFGEVV